MNRLLQTYGVASADMPQRPRMGNPQRQDVKPSRLASMRKAVRAAMMGQAVDRGGGAPETDRDRVDVSIEMLERPKLGSK